MKYLLSFFAGGVLVIFFAFGLYDHLVQETVDDDSVSSISTQQTSQERNSRGELIETRFQTYENRRFGFSVKVPAQLEKTSTPQNNDGAVFESEKTETMLRVFGTNNVLDETLGSLIEEAREDFVDVLVEVEENQVTLIGTDPSGFVRAEKIILKNNIIYRFEFSYAKGTIDDRTRDQMLASFQNTDSSE